MNITGKYLKAWKIEDGEHRRKIDLGDSRKDKDGNYVNWTWFGCRIVGNAKSVQINEGDTVEVKSGIIEMNKSGDKWYTNITIFEIEVMQRSQQQAQPSQVQNAQKVFSAPTATAEEFPDDIPF